jgi:hypothetical protein
MSCQTVQDLQYQREVSFYMCLKQRNIWEDLDVDESVVLKQILNK